MKELLKKYIIYAKERIRPKLNNIDQDKISKAYADLRRQSMATGSLPITVRHIESVIRMSEAHAKMHLREYINDDDVNIALRVMLESFVATQKYSVMKTMTKNFSQFLNYRRESEELLLFLLKQLVHDKAVVQRSQYAQGQHDAWKIEISEKEFQDKAKQMNVTSIRGFLQSDLFKTHHFTYDAERKFITHLMARS